MSNLIHAAESIKLLATQYQHMIEAAEALNRIGSLENAEKEAKQAIDSTRKELEKTKVNLVLAKDEFQSLKADAKSLVEGAELEANQLLVKAKADSDAMLADATIKAKIIENSALEAVKSELNTIKANKLKAEKAVESAITELNATIDERNKAAQELADLQSKIESAKAAVLKLLGDHQ